MGYSLTGLLLLLTAVGAQASQPVVGIIDIPMKPGPVEQLPGPKDKLPPEPVAPKRPKREQTSEAKWSAYRAAEAEYQAAKESFALHVALMRDQKRRASEASKLRIRADRLAASNSRSIESSVRRLHIFSVQNPQQIRSAITKGMSLTGCDDSTCLLEVATQANVHYLVSIGASIDSPELTVQLWHRTHASLVLIQSLFWHPTTSSKTMVEALFQPALDAERKQCVTVGIRYSDALQWEKAAQQADRCLALGPHGGAALFLAGTIAFHRSSMGNADRWLRAAIEQKYEIGQASDLLARIALRMGNTAVAATYFDTAVNNGHETFEGRLVLGKQAFGKNPKESAEHLTRAAFHRPHHGEVHFLLAQLAMANTTKVSANAQAHLRKAIDADFRSGEAHFFLGQAALQSQDNTTAVVHLEEALARGITNGASLEALGRLLLEKKPHRAMLLLAQARSRGQSSALLNYDLGRAAALAQQPGQAIGALRRAVALGEAEPWYGNANLLLARQYTLQGNGHLAAKHFSMAIKVGADAIDARQSVAEDLGYQHDWNNALLHNMAALGFDSKSGKSHFGAATALLHLGQLKKARSHFTQAIHAQYHVASSYEQLGNIAYAQGDQDSGLAHLRRSVAAGSNNISVYRRIAQQTNNMASWEHLLSLAPMDAEASFVIGNYLYQKNVDTSRAIKLLRHATGASMYRGKAHRALGNLYWAASNSTEAFAHLKEALKNGEVDFEILQNLGNAAGASNNQGDSLHYLLRALAFHPGDHALALRVATLQLNAGLLEPARLLAQRTLVANHQIAACHHLLGRIAQQNNETAIAAVHFEKSIKAGLASAVAHAALGEHTLASGAPKEAAAHFITAVGLAVKEENPQLAKRILVTGRSLLPNNETLAQMKLP